MNAGLKDSHPGDVHGHVLLMGERHHIAIYLRRGLTWVAEFKEGYGELTDATTWFRFNCRNLANSHDLRRMALESAMPISAELGLRIEALHAAAIHRRGQTLSELVAAITASVRQSHLATLMAARFRRRRAHTAPSAR